MDDKELNSLKVRVKKAEDLKASIKNMDKMLINMDNGKCKDIRYLYEGPAVGTFGQMDEVGEGNCSYSQTISAETIGIAESVFSGWFSVQLINYLKECRDTLKEELNNLK